MCFCASSIRTPFCPNCNAAMFERIMEVTAERDAVEKQRDELLEALETIESEAEECLDFDEFTAMLVPIDAYHKLIEAIAKVKGGAA